MKQKLYLILILLIILSASLLNTSCAENRQPILEQFLEIMTRMTGSSLEQASIRLENIEQQIDQIRTRQYALEQVGAPAREWIAIQEENAKKYKWSRKMFEVVEDLPLLRNDKYEVAKLQFTIESLSNYKGTIDIYDVATGKIAPYEIIKKSLNEQEQELIKTGNELAERMTLATDTLKRILNTGEFEINALNKTTYTILGPLGLNQSNNLIKAQWTYYTDVGRIEPADQPATALKNILSVR